MTDKEKDLCKTCEHYWQDFPLPLDKFISHCEILDKRDGIFKADMDEKVPYPCMECPFNSYVKKK